MFIGAKRKAVQRYGSCNFELLIITAQFHQTLLRSTNFSREHMLIPSIDFVGGRIVQLVQGEKLKLAFDDFEYWIGRFQHYPLVQLIDLDAAMRQGENSDLITKIAGRLPCQVGGGISTVEKAAAVLSAGARRVIIGSALFGGASLVNTAFARHLAEAVGRA